MTSPRDNSPVPTVKCRFCEDKGYIEFQQPVPQANGMFALTTVRHKCVNLCGGTWEGWRPPNAGRTPAPGMPRPMVVDGELSE